MADLQDQSKKDGRSKRKLQLKVYGDNERADTKRMYPNGSKWVPAGKDSVKKVRPNGFDPQPGRRKDDNEHQGRRPLVKKNFTNKSPKEIARITAGISAAARRRAAKQRKQD